MVKINWPSNVKVYAFCNNVDSDIYIGWSTRHVNCIELCRIRNRNSKQNKNTPLSMKMNSIPGISRCSDNPFYVKVLHERTCDSEKQARKFCQESIDELKPILNSRNSSKK